LFMRDFYSQAARLAGPFLVLHEAPAAGAEALHFASKRISAQLSEAMVPNMILAGSQRGFLQGQAPQVRAELPLHYWQTVQAIVSYPHNEAGVHLAPAPVLAALQDALAAQGILLFTENPRSALGAEQASVPDAASLARLLAAYGEEADVLRLASQLPQARICTPDQLAAAAC
ncbi:MAG: hypothetical protein ACK5QE_03280, partial [Sphingobacteriia bacterium]